jgi:hypothetical protein
MQINLHGTYLNLESEKRISNVAGKIWCKKNNTGFQSSLFFCLLLFLKTKAL